MDIEQTFANEDLRTFSNISHALWANSELSKRSALETLSAVSLQDLTPPRILEKASGALLAKAKKGGVAINTQANLDFIGQPFFRLSVEERLLLVGLHLGRWSYKRLSRVLQISIEELQEIAWNARLRLITSLTYPAAPSPLSPHCPAYDPRKPWTQRYLDDEIPSGRDRFFLQGHLISCEACHACLLRCKTVYFQVEKIVMESVNRSSMGASQDQIFQEKSPRNPVQDQTDDVTSLKEVLRKSSLQKYPTQVGLWESLVIFAAKPEMKWFLFGWVFLIAGLMWRKISS